AEALLAFGCNPLEQLGGGVTQQQLGSLGLLFAADTHSNGFTEMARLVVPLRGPFESEGSYTNEAGRVQALRPVVPAPEGCRAGWQVVAALAEGLGAEGFEYGSVFQVSEELAGSVGAFAGLTLGELPELGQTLSSGAGQKTGESDAGLDAGSTDE
ncbi:MAG: hypothetical protein D6806_16760, partial [Deltaproteobacteria bacterium]